VVDDADALLRQRRHDLVVEDGVLVGDQRVRLGRERLDAGRAGRRAGQPRRFQAIGEADLEELVEVRRDDAHVAQALEKRHVLPLRLDQDASVEFEDRAFAIEERRCRHPRLGDG
jgi:hypothetical protein